jgi:tripartite-type tricarboxylate transporter receptor subunit TctC
MKLLRRKFLYLAAGAAVSTLLFSTGAWSQAARTIKVVVPFAAGGPTDILARLLVEHISRVQGLTMFVENRPGAMTAIGTEAVSRAAPDGNSLLITGSAFVSTPLLRTVSYNPLTSFEPICQLVSATSLILVNSASPYRTLADLLDAARAKPGDLTLASFGPAAVEQIAFEMLKHVTKVNMTFVPYSGYAPAVNALLGGHVTSVLADYSSSAEHLKAGKLRAIATASRTRLEALPDLPTVAESGYQDFEVDLWWGLYAPAKTPKETIFRLAGWFATALQVPEIKEKLAVQELYPAGICGLEFKALIRKQYDEFARAIRESNFKLE